MQRLANTERVARYCRDTARPWSDLKHRRRTFAALGSPERTPPENARRPAVRAITAALLADGPPLPGLRDFAARTGAATA